MKKRYLLLIIIMLVIIVVVYWMMNSQATVEGIETEENNQVFEYTEETEDVEACYISVVYMDGYAYSPIEWFSNGLYQQHPYNKGEKIGEVTLDLKGLNYTGLPPDFSSTHDIGTAIYEIEGIKSERAVIMVDGSYETVLYRERRSVVSEKDPINLNLYELFEMISNQPEVVSLELRSEENGAWVSDIFNEDINRFFNDHGKALQIMNRGELDSEPYSNPRIPINIILRDGAAVHMQVYPKTYYAYVFGGYIQVTDAFVQSLESAIQSASSSPLLVDLIPYTNDAIDYMTIEDYLSEKTILCDEPHWSSEALFMILSYYRVSEIADHMSQPIASFALGVSEEDHKTITIYEDLSLSIDTTHYEIIKGQFTYEDILLFIQNYTN